jgi:hypothetical protein
MLRNAEDGTVALLCMQCVLWLSGGTINHILQRGEASSSYGPIFLNLNPGQTRTLLQLKLDEILIINLFLT